MRNPVVWYNGQLVDERGNVVFHTCDCPSHSQHGECGAECHE